MRKYGRKDNNQKEIVQAFETLGFKVVDMSSLGGGVGDILVGVRGKNIQLEIKGPDGKQEDTQVEFKATWTGQYDLVRSVKQAFEACGIETKN